MKTCLSCLLLLFCLCSAQAKTRKAVYIVLDGIPADYIERVRPTHIFDIARQRLRSRLHRRRSGRLLTNAYHIGHRLYEHPDRYVDEQASGKRQFKPETQLQLLVNLPSGQSQKKPCKTALFSSWTDNRTVLIGAGKPETGNLTVDYVYDGYELDETRFPPRPDQLHIFSIDSVVSHEAAQCIRRDAPDLSWVYLWYTDSGFHLFGDGAYMDRYVRKTDELVGLIWQAVQYCEAHFDEEWMVIVTTDHGRNESGHGHGGQLNRERSVWISTNIRQLNRHFTHASLSLVDIQPTLSRFMGFEVPQEVAFERDGISFFGPTDIYDLASHPYDHTVVLSWKSEKTSADATIYMATTNRFASGGTDEWKVVGKVKARSGRYVVDLSQYPSSKFYKFAVATPCNVLTRWVCK
mgnify:CR=1 FL=1